MKLTPHAQKQADEWLDKGGSPEELTEILGIARGGIGAGVSGHCYRAVNDKNFSVDAIEEMIEDEARVELLRVKRLEPTEEELEWWRQACREAQEATRFFIWKIPFTRESLFLCTVHRKNGYVDRIDGPYHSADAAMPYGEIVLD